MNFGLLLESHSPRRTKLIKVLLNLYHIFTDGYTNVATKSVTHIPAIDAVIEQLLNYVGHILWDTSSFVLVSLLLFL